MTSSAIPNRSVFRAQEVCEIAQVQPYVLKSWEAEFPDLGMSKTANGQRVYRRGDVERVLRLKDLLFKEGLTLAGARRRLAEEGVVPVEDDVTDGDVAALMDQEVRQHLRDVRRGLQWVLSVLDGEGVTAEDFVLMTESPNGAGSRKGVKKSSAKASAKAKPKAAAGSQKAASRGGRKTAPAAKRAKRKSSSRPKAK